ncbi:MAG: ComEC/Rec2 family competence protein [Oscillospiraceae bacterium]
MPWPGGRAGKLPAVAAKLRAALFASASASLGAMVFTTPLVACSFDLVSLAAIGVNFLVLWAVSLCFQLGLVICLVGFVLPGVAAFFAGLLSWLVRYFWWIVRGAARLPFAAVYTSSVYLAAWVVFAYLLLAVFLLQKQKRPLQFALCLASLAASVGLSWLENSLAEVQTTVLDVGQGQCVLLEVDGKSILVHCGGSNPEEAGEQAARALLAHGKFHLDLLLLTHYDADHAGGVAYLLGGSLCASCISRRLMRKVPSARQLDRPQRRRARRWSICKRTGRCTWVKASFRSSGRSPACRVTMAGSACCAPGRIMIS